MAELNRQVHFVPRWSRGALGLMIYFSRGREQQERIRTMVVPSIFVAGSDVRSALHHHLLSVLRDEGADTWLYEWSSGEDPLSADVAQALYERPVTLITVSDADSVPDAIPRILRSAKGIALFNPARLVLPLPVGLIDAERLMNLFP